MTDEAAPAPAPRVTIVVGSVPMSERERLARAARPRSPRRRPLPLRLEGAVWGHLVGDAVGVPYEFRGPAGIGGPDRVEFGATGSHGQPPGTWSDDGALMLALLDSLLEAGWDPEDQGRRAVDWYRTGAYAVASRVFDIGTTTSRALDALGRGTPALEAGPADDLAQGNGSLMRILPIGLWGHGSDRATIARQAADASRVTHGHPSCRVACAVYALLVDSLLDGLPPPAALQAAFDDVLDAASDPEGDAALRALAAWPHDHDPRGRGWVVDSFWSAWDAFEGADDYADAIRRAVALGHDTDTTAAIAGGLAGAYWGIESIPAAWRAGMRDQDLVRRLVDRLIRHHGWRTSVSHPLRVGWPDLVAAPGLAGASGALGITFLIGKRLAGWSGEWWRDLEADADRLRDVHGATTYVQLVEDHELVETRTTRIAEVLAARDIRLVRHPVEDMSTPADAAAYGRLADDLGARIRAGERVVVACRGGLGRSGTLVACLLVDAGMDPDAAIAATRAARPNAIERGTQVDFVRAWAGRRS